MYFYRVIKPLAALVIFCAGIGAAQSLPLQHPLQDKNFYLLSLLSENPAAQHSLEIDKAINAIAAERQDELLLAQRSCKGDAACIIKAFLWTDEEIQAVSLELERMAQQDASLRAFVDRKLRPSRAYVVFENQSAGEMLANAWQVCARGMNDVLSVYGEALPPRYPAIDSISADINSPEFKQQVVALTENAAASDNKSQLFFEPALNAALQLLTISHRDEAGRHEPMDTGVNKVALKSIPLTHWQKYPYTVIVVPGAGSVAPNIPLSEIGRKRTSLAADAFKAGKAPFILVSGGYVHPSQTRYSEAIEMKKALIEDFHVPESAILVDPHARHTTTNMRNAAREIYSYGMPFNKPAIVISDASQIGYIAGQPFADRCIRELGYMPYQILRHEGDTGVVFLPETKSLQQDPIDPLDP